MNEISRQMKCGRCAVQSTNRRFDETGSYKNEPKSGRKRLTTIREDRVLERMYKRNRGLYSKELCNQLNQQCKLKISPRTVRRASLMQH